MKATTLWMVLLSATALPLQAVEKSKPNIILIMADDMGYECVGANGSTSYQTPRLDQLAMQGMRFEQCHAHLKHEFSAKAE